VTYRKFARLHNISPQWLCQILNGAKISDDLAMRLSATTGKPVSVFFGEKEKRREAVIKYIKNNN